MIKSIHQTWKNRNPPEDIFRRDWANSWKANNPEWNYRLWTDDEICDFVFEEFPDFFPIWCSYPKQIMRVDAWRYLLLKRQGGLYVDLDIAALRPLDPWIERFVGFSCADQGDGYLCNALMWAPEPELPFLEDIVTALVAAAYLRDPLDATGPKFLHRYASLRRSSLSQISTSNVFPITVWDRGPLPEAKEASLEVLSDKFLDAMSISFWTGSWTEQRDTLIARPISEDSAIGLETCDLFFAVVVKPGRPQLCRNSRRYYNSIQGVTPIYFKLEPWVACDEVAGDGTIHEVNIVPVLASFLASGKEWAFVFSEATYVVPQRLASVLRRGVQFVANESLLIEQKPNRDAGYLICRSLAQVLIASGAVHTEADLARYLVEQDIPVEITPLLRHDRYRYPTYSNQVVSTAFSDPRHFMVIPGFMNPEKVQAIRCAHQCWTGDLEFHEGGGCIRPATGCCGLWQPFGDGHRRIDWFDWPREIMLAVGDGLGFVINAEHAAPLFNDSSPTIASDF